METPGRYTQIDVDCDSVCQIPLMYICIDHNYFHGFTLCAALLDTCRQSASTDASSRQETPSEITFSTSCRHRLDRKTACELEPAALPHGKAVRLNATAP